MDHINHLLNLEIMKLAKQIENYTEILNMYHQNLYIKNYSKYDNGNKHINFEFYISKFVRETEKMNQLQNENVEFKNLKKEMEISLESIESFYNNNFNKEN